jgi:hypothetical protein
VNEIELFGIRVFEVSIVRVYKRDATPPLVRNRSKSISVVNVETRTLPSLEADLKDSNARVIDTGEGRGARFSSSP